MPHVDAALRKAYMKAYGARYYAKNADKWILYAARFCAANPKKSKTYSARYYAKNSEKVNARRARYDAEHPEKARARKARYHAEHPEGNRAHCAKRRARKLAAGGKGITARQWQEVMDSSLGLCTYCNERRPLALDHIVPLSGGGEHDIENAVPACQSCNGSKHKAPLLLWLARRAA